MGKSQCCPPIVFLHYEAKPFKDLDDGGRHRVGLGISCLRLTNIFEEVTLALALEGSLGDLVGNFEQILWILREIMGLYPRLDGLCQVAIPVVDLAQLKEGNAD